jgi:hypothetical protein
VSIYGDLLYGDKKENNELEVFLCSNNSDCSNKSTYTQLSERIIYTISNPISLLVGEGFGKPEDSSFECLPISETNGFDTVEYVNCNDARLASTEPEIVPWVVHQIILVIHLALGHQVLVCL